MAVGNVAGGYIGARTAVARGSGFVRAVFVLIVSAFIVSAAFQKVDIPTMCAKKSAYRRGQAAYRSGMHTNPYDLDDSRHQDWWDGYQASQASSGKEQDHVA